MSKRTFFVYSSLPASQIYTNYAAIDGRDMQEPVGEVHIRGGAHVADRRENTALGVVTEINEDQLAILKTNQVFLLHEKNGFILVSDAKVDADLAALDMTSDRSPDAPLVEGDFENVSSSEARPSELNQADATLQSTVTTAPRNPRRA